MKLKQAQRVLSSAVIAFSDSLLIVALFFLAVAQPLLALLSRQAEFFVARCSEPIDIATMVAVLGLFPLALALGLRCLGLLSRRLGSLAHGVVSSLLLALVGLVTLHAALGAAVVIPLALGLGVAAAFRFHQDAEVRSLLGALSGVVLVYAVGCYAHFLLLSPVSRIVRRDINRAILYKEVRASTPVVFVVFDEFPLATLLDAQGGIDNSLFPNFARLASKSTWYSRTATVADFTDFALPPILSGSRPTHDKLPICADYPHNLFVFLGGNYERKCQETGSALVPPGQDRNLNQPYSQRMQNLGRDLAILYLYQITPKDLESRLPDVRHQWADFGVAAERRPFLNRPLQYHRFLDHLSAQAERVLYYHHSVLPHYPYEYLPSGTSYDTFGEVVAEGLGRVGDRDVWTSEWTAAQGYQRHMLQAVFCDRLLGELIDQLEQKGLYDRALLVVTADHGASFRNGMGHRLIDKDNFMDIAAVPLFIKAPKQSSPRRQETVARTIDILPTLAALLKERLPWRVEGVSLLDAAPNDEPLRVMRYTDGAIVESPWDGAALQRMTAHKEAVFGSSGGVERLYRIGPHPELLGTSPASAGAAPGELVLDWLELLDKVEPQAGFQPNRIHGRITAVASGEEVALAVAVNGRIQATTRAVGAADGSATFSALVPADSLQKGHNQVDVYRIGSDQGLARVALRPPVCYTLGEGKIESSLGAIIPIEPGRLSGAVPHVAITENAAYFGPSQSAGGVRVRGWAQDAGGAPVEKILFFYGDRFVLEGVTGLDREDIERHFGREKGEGGFRYTLPATLVNGGKPEGLRIFAVKGGVATELPVDLAHSQMDPLDWQ